MQPPDSPPATRSDWKDSLYERLADDDEGRVCKGISEEACRQSPGNFLHTLAANTLTSIGDRLGSAKTTLPWLLGHLGAPAWIASLLVPVRESGSMLPQILIGAWVRRKPVRKGVWVLGSLIQGACLGGIALTVTAVEGLAAGLLVLALLTVFSLARGACSVAYKDVLGKTIPKSRRGRLAGWISAVSGLGAMGAGLLFSFASGADSRLPYIFLPLGGGLLFLAASGFYGRIREEPGETGGGANGVAEALAKLSILRDDPPFRRFVIGRALAMGSGLAAPFYVTLARGDLGSAAAFLGIFIAIEGLAGLVSAPVWGRWADRSSRLVFATAGGMAGIMSVTTAVWAWLSPPAEAARWFYPAAFFVLGVAHAGVRLGRKTYLVDMAEGNKRTDYVAVSNTVIGALLLFSGLVGALASVFSVPGALLLFGLAGVAGAVLGLGWKEVSEDR